jgi:transcription elongation factor Elf1
LHVDPDISEEYEPNDPHHDLDARFIYEEEPEEVESPEIPYHMKDLATLTEEEVEKNRDNVLGVDGETKPDFVEEVNDQLYLMYITYEDRNYLDLYNFDSQLKNSAIEADDSLDYNCPKMLYRSMGLQGYFNPILKDGTIEECPNLELTCCTNHDFEELEKIWEDSLKPTTEAGHYYMEYYVKTTLVHGEAYHKAAERLIEVTSDELCLKVAHSILDFEITDELRNKTIELLAHVKEYDTRVKKSYPCLVCNHENIQYFDFKNRILGLKGEVCLDIVHNLIEYYQHFNGFFYKYFNSLYFMARCIDKHVDIEKEEEEKLEEELHHTEEEIHADDPHMKGTFSVNPKS